MRLDRTIAIMTRQHRSALIRDGQFGHEIGTGRSAAAVYYAWYGLL